MRAAQPLMIPLKPSRRLAAVLVAAHLAAVGAIVTAPLPLWLTILAAAALLAHGAWVMARVALRLGASAIVAVEAGHSGMLPFQTRDGAWHTGRLLGTTYVGPVLTILNIEEHRKRRVRHALILVDAIDPEDFRRLRVWLRWGPKQAPEQS